MGMRGNPRIYLSVVALAAASFSISADSAGVGMSETYSVENIQAKTQSPHRGHKPGPGVSIHYQGDGKTYQWELNDYWRSSDESPSDLLRVDDSGVKYLIFLGWSGGANCCWSAHLYNLSTGKYEGVALESESPIGFEAQRKSRRHCSLVVVGSLAKDRTRAGLTTPSHFCFQNGRFSRIDK
jgi:hypothetical protein